MPWKEQLQKLEQEEAFDIAIFFMQKIIAKHPDERDAYLSMIYLIADTVIEPHSWDFDAYADQAKRDYYKSKENEYSTLGERYFARSYFKFNNDASYLLVAAHAFITLPWIFGIDTDFRDAMLYKAHQLEPNNPIYKGIYYKDIYDSDPTNPELFEWAKLMTNQNSPLKQFTEKGRVWEYAVGIAQYFPNQILETSSFDKEK